MLRFPTLPLACLLALTACTPATDASDPAKADTRVLVETTRPVRQAIAATVSATAPLQAHAQVQVVSKASGVAKAVEVQLGDTVPAGAVLVRLDGDAARVALAQARAQVDKLAAYHARASIIAREGMLSATDLDQVRFDLAAARAARDLAALELSWSTITAPIAGQVASVLVKPGNFVAAGQAVAEIVDASRLQAHVDLPERDVSLIGAGQPVALSVDALPGASFTGKVAHVSPVIDASSGTFRVVVEVDPRPALKPGMFARLVLSHATLPDALLVPRQALLEGTAPAVFVVDNATARRREVRTGIESGGLVQVVEGLDANDAVVVAGLATLSDGQAVEVIAPPPPRQD